MSKTQKVQNTQNKNIIKGKDGRVYQRPAIEKVHLFRKLAIDKEGREMKSKEGAPIYNYELPVVLSGKNYYATFSAPRGDVAAFATFNLVFGDGVDKAEFVREVNELNINGNRSTQITYFAKRFCEIDEVEHVAQLSAPRTSDRSVVENFYRAREVQLKKAREAGKALSDDEAS
ncbi:MAG: hypothetical protein FWB72_05945 [Firmicutes bacterium]|nr:hypothetical protein [Bacillota bacterium]